MLKSSREYSGQRRRGNYIVYEYTAATTTFSAFPVANVREVIIDIIIIIYIIL